MNADDDFPTLPGPDTNVDILNFLAANQNPHPMEIKQIEAMYGVKWNFTTKKFEAL